MVSILQEYTLFNDQDLITPSTTQKYALGLEIVVRDPSKKARQVYKYVKAHAALTAYQPYVLSFSSTSGGEVVTAAPATLAAPGSLVVVPQVAIASGSYGFVLIEGDGKVLMTAETYAVGDFLQVLNAGTALVVDGTSGATVQLVNSSAICKEAGTTAVARAVYLLGNPAVVAAT